MNSGTNTWKCIRDETDHIFEFLTIPTNLSNPFATNRKYCQTYPYQQTEKQRKNWQ